MKLNEVCSVEEEVLKPNSNQIQKGTIYNVH